MIELPLHEPLPVYAILAFLAVVIPVLSEKLRIPASVGLIVSGILIGKSALNLVGDSEAVHLPAELGLLYLMLLAGLEIDLDLLRKRLRDSVVFGISTFMFPFVLGFGLGSLALGFGVAGGLMTGAMFAAHTLLALPQLSHFGLSRTPLVSAVVGGTIITDVLAILIIGIVAGEQTGGLDWIFALKLTAFLVFTLVAMQWVIPKLGKWFYTRVTKDPVVEFMFVLVIFFTFSFVADAAGLESIIGAIFAGIALNRLIPENSVLMNRVNFVGQSIFIPVFLISVGLIVDLRMLFESAEAWIVAGVLTFGALGGKLIASLVGGAVLKTTWPERWLMFGLSAPHATAALAAILVGHNVGLFDDSLLAGAVMLILVSSILGPVVTRRAAAQIVKADEGAGERMKEQPQRIMIALRSEEQGPALVDLALLVREKTSHEPIHPLNVVIEGQNPEAAVASAEKLMTASVVRAQGAGVPVTPLARTDFSVKNGVLRAMLDQRISTLIAGWDGERGAYGSIYGPALDGILQESKQLVFISHLPRPLNTCDRLVVFLPPLIERQEGFLIGLRTIRTLSAQLGGRVVYFLSQKSRDEVAAIDESLKPSTEAEFVTFSSFNQVLEESTALKIQEADLLVVFSARIGHIAWQPRVERLPLYLHRRYRKNSLFAAFMPTSVKSEEGVLSLAERSGERPLFGDSNIVQVPANMTLHASIGRMLEPLNLGSWIMRELQDKLVRIAQREPVELRPGTVLVHMHTDAISSTLIVLGQSAVGFNLGTGGRAQELVVLLSPRFLLPEDHLKNLSTIAQEIRKRPAVDQPV